MTPSGVAVLRMAATLGHGLPGLRIRLRDGQRTLLEVGASTDASVPSVGPCAFRRAVVRAHEQTKAGIRLAFMDLPEGVEPAVDIGVRAGDRALPGGIYRVAVGGSTIHGFATTLAPRQCRAVLHGSAEPGALRLHHDAGTEVTLVHTVDAADGFRADPHRLLEDALAACLADEVVQEVVRAGR